MVSLSKPFRITLSKPLLGGFTLYSKFLNVKILCCVDMNDMTWVGACPRHCVPR